MAACRACSGAEPRGRPVAGKPRSTPWRPPQRRQRGFPRLSPPGSRVRGASPGTRKLHRAQGSRSPRGATDQRDCKWDPKRAAWCLGVREPGAEPEIRAEPSPPPPPRARLPPPPVACSAPPSPPRLWRAARAEPWEPRTAPAAAAGATPAAPCGSWPSRSGCEPYSLGSSCK